jgi:S-methylmethionine-dependent homocysteine/selenocysteine methylase
MRPIDVAGRDLVLMEAAVVERLRRDPLVGARGLHPRLVHAPLLLERDGRRALRAIYDEYVDLAQRAGLPILLCTPTWRANLERATEDERHRAINRRAAEFLRELREARPEPGSIGIGGLIGCRHDCYRPDQSLDPGEAERFAAWQVDELALGGVDFLMAATLPAVDEAVGIARAMVGTGLPFLISFVVDRSGRLLDGSTLAEAFDRVDDACDARPLGYMVNCAHPSFVEAAGEAACADPRLVGVQANASSLDHADLDGATALQVDDVDDWAERMLRLHARGVKILGGCCGTDASHLEALVERYGRAPAARASDRRAPASRARDALEKHRAQGAHGQQRPDRR